MTSTNKRSKTLEKQLYPETWSSPDICLTVVEAKYITSPQQDFTPVIKPLKSHIKS